MSAKPIKEIIDKYLNRTNILKVKNLAELEKNWKDIAGPQIAKNTEITSIKNGKLIIKTSNPTWRCELSLQKNKLLVSLNKTNKKEKIKDIIFR